MCHGLPGHQISMCPSSLTQNMFSLPGGRKLTFYAISCFQGKVQELGVKLSPIHWIMCGFSWSREPWANRGMLSATLRPYAISEQGGIGTGKLPLGKSTVVEDIHKVLTLSCEETWAGRRCVAVCPGNGWRSLLEQFPGLLFSRLPALPCGRIVFVHFSYWPLPKCFLRYMTNPEALNLL